MGWTHLTSEELASQVCMIRVYMLLPPDGEG